MIIGIDATAANKQKRTGVEWYAYHLIQEFKKLPIAQDDRVVLYSAGPLQDDLKDLPERWEVRVLSWPPKKAWRMFRLNWEMLRRKPDVLFVPANKLPFFRGRRTITAVHDIGADRVLQVYEPKVRRRVRSATKRAVKKADQILTISEFTKQELIDVYKVPADKIVVTWLAADTDRYKQMRKDDIAQVLSKYRLGTSYLFHIGRLEAKKNIITLIKAYEMFKKQRGVGDPFELVLAGSPGFKFSEIKRFLDASGVKDSIRVLGHVPEEDVPALMNGATLYLFPSWYEGFGIPLLEAMACGTAVLASEAGALQEVAGEAAAFAHPREAQTWSVRMSDLVFNAAKREELVEKGLTRVKQFSWKKAAEQTWEAIQSFKSQKTSIKKQNKKLDHDPNFLDA